MVKQRIDETMTKPMDVGSLRVGGYMIIDNEPCRIVDITKSKPGKHGAAKARIVAIGVFDGQKRQFVKPVDATIISILTPFFFNSLAISTSLPLFPIFIPSSRAYSIRPRSSWI